MTSSPLFPAASTRASRKARVSRRILAGSITAAIASLAAVPAQAATTYTFTGATSENLNTAGNYSTPTANPATTTPTAGDTVVFSNQDLASGATGILTVTTLSLASLQFDANALAFTIGAAASPGTLTFDGASSITSATSNNEVINSNVTIGTNVLGTTNITNNGTGTLTINGTITTTGSSTAGVRTLAVDGTGSVKLGNLPKGTATNFLILKTNTGTLTLGDSATAADNTGTILNISNGTVLLGKASSATIHALNNSSQTLGGGLLQITGSGNDQIGDSAQLNFTGAAVFDLFGHNETVGSLASAGGLGTVENTSATTPGTLTLSGSGTYSGVLVDGGGKLALTKTGTGVAQILSGTNTYSGATTISSGAIDFQKVSALSSATAVTVGAAGIIGLGVGSVAGSFATADLDALFAGTTTATLVSAPNTIALSATSIIGIDPTDSSLTYTPLAGSAHGLAKLGANTLVLNTSNSYTGGTTLFGGVLSVGNAAALGTGGITGAGGTLLPTVDLSGANALTAAVALPGSLTIAGTQNVTLNGAVSGAGAFNVASSGTLTFGASNSFTGGLNLSNAATVKISGAGTFGASTSAITLASGTMLDLNGLSRTVGVVANSGTVTNNGTANSTLTLTGGATGSTSSGSFKNGATNTLAITVLAGGTTFSGTSSYSGGTSIAGTAGTTAYLQLTNAAGTGAGTGAISIASGNALLLGAAMTVANNITGAGAVENYNGSAQNDTLTGTLSYTGPTLFRTAGSTVTFNPSADSTLSGAIGTINAAAAGFGGIATVAGGLVVKTGNNKLTLTGTSVYTGTTTVSGGTLALGSGGNLGATAVTVGTGGTFAAIPGAIGATNALTGSITLSAGGAFTMADNATSTFNVTGNSVLVPASGSSSLTFDIGGATTAAADKLAIAGTATVGAGTGTISINGFGTVGPNAAAGNYTIITGAAGSGLGGSGFTLATPTITIGPTQYSVSLSASTATSEIVTLSGGTQVLAYFTGAANPMVLNATSGGTTNFSADAAGTTDLGGAPTAAEALVFSATNAAQPVNITSLGQPYTVRALNFNTGTTTISDSTNGFTLTSGITVASGAGPVTLNVPLTLSAAQSYTNNSASPLLISGTVAEGTFALTSTGSGATTFNGAISGSGGFIKSGTGTTTLAVANAYTGGTTILGGVLSTGNLASLGSTSNPLTFGDATGATGTLNPTASLSVGALTVATSSASSSATNTLNIATGATFTTTGLLNLGSNTAAAGLANSNLTVTGGAFVANLPTGNSFIGGRNVPTGTTTTQGASAILDLSGTSSASIVSTSATSNLYLGYNNSANATNSAADTAMGTLKLSTSGTNTVTLGTVILGYATVSGQAGIQGFINLGNAANNFNVNTLIVGNKKSGINGTLVDTLNFQGGGTAGGTFTLGGFTAGSKAILRIGFNDVSTGNTTQGLVDTTGGTFNGNLSTLSLGGYTVAPPGGSGGGKGTLTMTAGAVTADTIVFADNSGGTSTPANVVGTLNLSGGSVSINATTGTGVVSGTTTAASGTATINLSGSGLLDLNNTSVTLNNAASTVNLTGGTLRNVGTYSVAGSTNITSTGGTISRTIAGTSTFGAVGLNGTNAALTATAGTISTTGITNTVAGATVTVNGGTLNLNGGTIGGATPVTTSFQSGTLQAVGEINNGAGLNKISAGTLVLEGANAYTGPTNVSGGILSVSATGTLTGPATNTINVNNGGTLLLNASNSVTNAQAVNLGSATGGTLAFASGNAASVTQTFGALTLSQTSTIDFGGTLGGNTATANTFTFSSLTLNAGYALTISDYTVDNTGANTDHLAFTSAQSFSNGDLAAITFKDDAGNTFATGGKEVAFGGGFEIVPIVAIPEPSTLYSALLAAGLVGLRERRRFRRLLVGRK